VRAVCYLAGGLLLSWLSSVAAARFDSSADDPWAQARGRAGVVLPQLRQERWTAPNNAGHIEFRPRIPPAWYRGLADALLERHVSPETWTALTIPPLSGKRDMVYAWVGGEYRSVQWAAGEHLCYHPLGWPWRCFESWYFVDATPSGRPLLMPALGFEIGIYEKDAYNVFAAPRVTPIVPVMPALLWSVAFYAAGLYLLMSAPRFIRGILRRRWGRCPDCGYDRSGLLAGAPCPECGKLA